jgi:hypothetical protein
MFGVFGVAGGWKSQFPDVLERVVSEMHFYRLVSWSVLSARVKLMFGSTLYSG